MSDLGLDPSLLSDLQERSPSLTLSEALREILEHSIVSGHIFSGARINENAIASGLGVNRAAVRGALTALSESGLVEFVHNRGAYVRRIRLEDALELYDVRAGLARAAGRLAAMRATASELRALENLTKEMNLLADAEDVPEYDRLNVRFHQLLMEAAGNQHIIKFEAKVSRDIRLYLREGVMLPQTLRVSCREHAAILEAAVASDADATAAAFEFHVLSGRQRMLEYSQIRESAQRTDAISPH